MNVSGTFDCWTKFLQTFRVSHLVAVESVQFLGSYEGELAIFPVTVNGWICGGLGQ